MTGFTRGTWYTIQIDIDQSDTSTQKMRVYIESSGNQHGDEVSCDSDQANPIEGNKWGVVVASLGGAHYVDNLQLSTEAFDAP
jgi:hypothetical protein